MAENFSSGSIFFIFLIISEIMFPYDPFKFTQLSQLSGYVLVPLIWVLVIIQAWVMFPYKSFLAKIALA